MSVRQQIADLQGRVLRLELELTLLRIQMEGNKDHAQEIRD